MTLSGGGRRWVVAVGGGGGWWLVTVSGVGRWKAAKGGGGWWQRKKHSIEFDEWRLYDILTNFLFVMFQQTFFENESCW